MCWLESDAAGGAVMGGTVTLSGVLVPASTGENKLEFEDGRVSPGVVPSAMLAITPFFPLEVDSSADDSRIEFADGENGMGICGTGSIVDAVAVDTATDKEEEFRDPTFVVVVLPFGFPADARADAGMALLRGFKAN
jgi:hypothetical protein